MSVLQAGSGQYTLCRKCKIKAFSICITLLDTFLLVWRSSVIGSLQKLKHAWSCTNCSFYLLGDDKNTRLINGFISTRFRCPVIVRGTSSLVATQEDHLVSSFTRKYISQKQTLCHPKQCEFLELSISIWRLRMVVLNYFVITFAGFVFNLVNVAM